MSTLTGKTTFAGKRKNKQYGENRVCEKEDCIVKISKYNKSIYCYNHTEKSFGRVRGHELVK